MDAKRLSSAPTERNSLRQFLCVIGGLMCAVIYRHGFMPSMPGCISVQK